jgi:hypothetical protein
MRLFEIDSQQKEVKKMPHLFLDMDGVQADFFTQWARWWSSKMNDPNIQWYKDIGDKEQREISIAALQAEGPEFVYEFFATLPVLSGCSEILSWINQNKIPCTILSAPLRSPKEDKRKVITQASIEGKKYWLANHNPNMPAIFDGNKDRYATKGGQANVLIDDHKKYISGWENSGGIGILHRWNNTQETIQKLNDIYGPYIDK